MATDTFNDTTGDHLWGTDGNWSDGAKPIAGRDVAIAANKTCLVDGDYSGTTLAGLTIAAGATLGPKAASGAYKLTFSGAATITGTLGCASSGSFTSGAVLTITGLTNITVSATTGLISVGTYSSNPGSATGMYITQSGTLTLSNTTLSLSAGTVGTGTSFAPQYPLPQNVTLSLTSTLSTASTSWITGTGVISLYCTHPDHLYARSTIATSSSDTITIDTDLTTGNDALCWIPGAIVRLAESDGTLETETYTILAITSTTIQFTTTISPDKTIGTMVGLIDRNIKLVSSSLAANTYIINSTCATQMDLFAQFTSSQRGITFANPGLVGGSIISVAYPVNIGSAGRLYKCLIHGVASTQASSGLVSAQSSVWMGNGACFYYTGNLVFYDCVMGGNDKDVNAPNGVFTFYSTSLLSGTASEQFAYSSGVDQAIYSYLQGSITDASTYRFWTSAGSGTDEIVTVPSGKTRGYNMTMSGVATKWSFFQRKIMVYPGQKVRFRVYMNKTVSMSILPKAELLLSSQDPFLEPSYTALATWTMTNTTSTWENGIIEWSNTNAYPREVILRISCKNASGTLYFLPELVRIPREVNRGQWIN